VEITAPLQIAAVWVADLFVMFLRVSSRVQGPKRSTLKFSLERIIGNGSFGTVFEAKIVETGEVVAIKKVLQDRRFKVRDVPAQIDDFLP
jgi:hypothetical protein